MPEDVTCPGGIQDWKSNSARLKQYQRARMEPEYCLGGCGYILMPFSGRSYKTGHKPQEFVRYGLDLDEFPDPGTYKILVFVDGETLDGKLIVK